MNMNMQKCNAICKTGKQCLRNAAVGAVLCAFHSASANNTKGEATKSEANDVTNTTERDISEATKSEATKIKSEATKIKSEATKSEATKIKSESKSKSTDDDVEHKATTKKTEKSTCTAICSNGKKCVRKCCAGFECCGTHKPVTGTTTQLPLTSAHTIFVEDIDGIAYYLDTYGNIFKAEDILRQSLTPKVIGQYVRRSDGRCIFAA
jgi:hypothetical protein